MLQVRISGDSVVRGLAAWAVRDQVEERWRRVSRKCLAKTREGGVLEG